MNTSNYFTCLSLSAFDSSLEFDQSRPREQNDAAGVISNAQKGQPLAVFRSVVALSSLEIKERDRKMFRWERKGKKKLLEKSK